MSGFHLAVKQESEAFIRMAIDLEALRQVDAWDKGPAVVLTCGDLSQFDDRYNHCRTRISRKPHVIAMNGGAHLLDGCHPVQREFNWVPSALKQIRDAIKLKAEQDILIKKVVLFTDWPCGINMQHQVGAKQAFRSAIMAKRFLQDELPNDIKVALMFYLDHPAETLGPDHPLVREHPEADGLTFNFSSEAMLVCIQMFEADYSPEAATV